MEAEYIMPRMRSDWGCVQEIDRGRRYRLRWWAETPEGYRRCSEVVRGTRREAHDRLAAIRLAHSADAPCPTVGEAWESWYLPERRRRVESGDMAPSSLERYESVWAAHASGRWGKVPMDRVRPLDVQRWLDGMAGTSAAMALSVLRLVGDYGARYGVTSGNPFRERYVMPPSSTVRRGDAGVWRLSELLALWGAAMGSWAEPAVLLSAFGSCRVGESLACRAEEVTRIDSGRVAVAVVPVARQLAHQGRQVSEALKTERSRRPVVLPGPAGERMLAIARDMGPGWLVRDSDGGTVTQARYQRELDGAIGRAGLPRHPASRLRSSWQTYMRWDWGVEPRYIEPMMGHILPGVTGRHYDRPDADQYARIAAGAYAAHPYDAPDGTKMGQRWDTLGLEAMM